ncbi:MAG: nitronate monooxygenase [Burkholderiales bacterium]|nr:nitronate monooxygenase [Burkholderiales bacterium]
MTCLNDFSLSFKGRDFLPLMVGGMGTNISTAELVLAIEKLGGIAHLSDAMLPDVADKALGTRFTKERTERLKSFIPQWDKSNNYFDLDRLADATKSYICDVMDRAKGKGLVLVNCMEKLTMNDSLSTLKVRLNSALDAGIDGITLSAGLHLSSFKLMQENKRFNDALLGIVVSSTRALNLFLKKTASLGRLPDYVIVEGPLAGGHLGFGDDWKNFSLEKIVREVKELVSKDGLQIPVIAAGGIYSGKEATRFVKEVGADGIQAATRFTIVKESGLPDEVKQVYINAEDKDVEVNHFSPTGYPMRMLKSSPALSSDIRPNCESYGYLLNHGTCSYLKEWQERHQESTEALQTKCCLCTQMRNYKVWTCGTTVSKLKETTKKGVDGKWILPTAEEVWNDYKYESFPG